MNKFWVAPSYTNLDWHALRGKNEMDWTVAVKILRERLTDRFLLPADVLEHQGANSSGNQRYGFAILALDFIVVETIEAFRKGITNHSGNSEKLVVEFLQSAGTLNVFSSEKERGEAARSVYKRARCAIHHSGSTDVGVKVKVSGALLTFDGTKLSTLNRRSFHSMVKKELGAYLQEVLSGVRPEIRKNFTKKMDYICDLP